MDLKELMIDNYVCDPNGIYRVVVSVEKFSVALAELEGSERRYYDAPHIDPISITPSILEKCGFIKEYEDTDAYGESLLSYRYPAIRVLFRSGEIESVTAGNSIRKHILHLHQLQNWTFVSSGNHLTVNI